jgi:hypothetical protein
VLLLPRLRRVRARRARGSDKLKERAHSDVWTRVRVVVEWCDGQSSVCVCGLLDGVALRRTRDLVVGRSPFRSLMKSVRENKGNRP